jgi:hypothetical protein
MTALIRSSSTGEATPLKTLALRILNKCQHDVARTASSPHVPSVPPYRGRDSRDSEPAVALAKGHEIEERQAISEFDAGIPSEWTEGFASLQTMSPPAGWPQSRWMSMVDDAGHFLDRWAATAAALGWTTCDLFGAHPAAPWQKIDSIGLLPLINGAAVEAITEDSATLRLTSGARQRYFRRSTPGIVPIWSLA